MKKWQKIVTAVTIVLIVVSVGIIVWFYEFSNQNVPSQGEITEYQGQKLTPIT